MLPAGSLVVSGDSYRSGWVGLRPRRSRFLTFRARAGPARGTFGMTAGVVCFFADIDDVRVVVERTRLRRARNVRSRRGRRKTGEAVRGGEAGFSSRRG